MNLSGTVTAALTLPPEKLFLAACKRRMHNGRKRSHHKLIKAIIDEVAFCLLYMGACTGFGGFFVVRFYGGNYHAVAAPHVIKGDAFKVVYAA